MRTGFWCGDPRERDHLADPGVDGRIILQWDGETLAGLIWLKIGTGDRLVNAIMNLRVP